jgi:hypothetical protein
VSAVPQDLGARLGGEGIDPSAPSDQLIFDLELL